MSGAIRMTRQERFVLFVSKVQEAVGNPGIVMESLNKRTFSKRL